MTTDNSRAVLAFALMALFAATGAVSGASDLAIRLVFLGLAAVAGIVGAALLLAGRRVGAAIPRGPHRI